MDKVEGDLWADGGSPGRIAAYVCFAIGGFLVLLGLGVLIYLIYVKRRRGCCGPKKPISFYHDDVGELPAEHHVNPRVRTVPDTGTIAKETVVNETLKKPILKHDDNPRVHVVSESGDVFEDDLISEHTVTKQTKENNPRVHVVTETGDVYEDNLISEQTITRHYKQKNPKVRIVSDNGEVFEDFLISDSLEFATKVHDYGGPVRINTNRKFKNNNPRMTRSADHVDYAKTNGSVSNIISRNSGNHLRESQRTTNSAYSSTGRTRNKKRKKNKKVNVSKVIRTDLAHSEPVLNTHKKPDTPNWILKGHSNGTAGRRPKSLGHVTGHTSNKNGRKKHMVPNSIPVFAARKKKLHNRSYTPVHGSVQSLHSAGSLKVYSARPVISLDPIPKAAARGHKYIILDTGRPHSRTHVRKWIKQQHEHNSDSLRRVSDPTHERSGTSFESPRSEGVIHRVHPQESAAPSPRDNPDSTLPLHLRWSPSMRRNSLDKHSGISDSSFAIATNTLPKKKLMEGAATATIGERKPSPIPNGDVDIMDVTRL